MIKYRLPALAVVAIVALSHADLSAKAPVAARVSLGAGVQTPPGPNTTPTPDLQTPPIVVPPLAVLPSPGPVSTSQPTEPVAAPLAARVVVVTNTLWPASSAVAAHYMAARGIPAANLCPITVPWIGWGSWSDYQQAPTLEAIKTAVRSCVDRIGRRTALYLVLTPGVPYRVWLPDAGGRTVDSHLAALWEETSATKVRNVYVSHESTAANLYSAFMPLAAWRDLGIRDVYSVWRLWGDESGANRLVDAAIAAETAGGLKGNACYDAKYGNPSVSTPDSGYAEGENNIIRASEFALAAGFPTTLDVNDAEFGTAPAPLRCDGAALYAGWYSYGKYNDAFSFVDGSVAWHQDSASCVWTFAALSHGLTVSSCVIDEPFLDAMTRPDRVLRDLLAGAVVGDAVLNGTEYVDWVTLFIGDPLYCPFCVKH